MFSAELAMVAFAELFYVIDVCRLRRGWTLARIFGTNAIFSFAISTVITTLLSVIHIHFGGKSAALHTALYERFFASASAPRLSSLLYAIAFVLLNAARLSSLPP